MLVDILVYGPHEMTNLHGSSVGVGSDVTAVGLGVTLLHLADVLLGVVESLLGTGHVDGVVVVVKLKGVVLWMDCRFENRLRCEMNNKEDLRACERAHI